MIRIIVQQKTLPEAQEIRQKFFNNQHPHPGAKYLELDGRISFNGKIWVLDHNLRMEVI